MHLQKKAVRLENSKTTDLIKEICPKTRNSSYCFYLLGFQENATLPELGQASVREAVTSVILAEDVRGAREHDSCEKSRAKANIWSLLRNFSSGRRRCGGGGGTYGSRGPEVTKTCLYKLLRAVVTEAGACEKLFRPPIPPQPEDLKIVSQDFQDWCSIVLVISKLLAGEKL